MSEQETQSNLEEHHEETTQHGSRATSFNKAWTGVTGGLIGALIVGAIWSIVGYTQHDSQPIASIDGHQISQSAFHKKLRSEAGKQTLQQMIDNQLIKDGAKAQNIAASKQSVNTAVKSLEARYRITSNSQFKQFLQTQGLTRSQLNSILKSNILEKKLSEKGITISNKEIQDYYNKHKASFTPKGKKSPEPLSSVRSEIKSQLMQSKATPKATLLANLAKKYKVKIYSTKYSSIKASLEQKPKNPSTKS